MKIYSILFLGTLFLSRASLSFASDGASSDCDSVCSNSSKDVSCDLEYESIESATAFEDSFKKAMRVGDFREARNISHKSGLKFDDKGSGGVPYFAYLFLEKAPASSIKKFFSEKINLNQSCGNHVNLGHYLLTFAKLLPIKDSPFLIKERLKILFDNGLNRDEKNAKGETYLQHAVRKKLITRISFFLENDFHKEETDMNLIKMKNSTSPWSQIFTSQFYEEIEARRFRRQDKRRRNDAIKAVRERMH